MARPVSVSMTPVAVAKPIRIAIVGPGGVGKTSKFQQLD